MAPCVLLTIPITREFSPKPSPVRTGAHMTHTLGRSQQSLTFDLSAQLLGDCGQSLNLARLSFPLCKMGSFLGWGLREREYKYRGWHAGRAGWAVPANLILMLVVSPSGPTCSAEDTLQGAEQIDWGPSPVGPCAPSQHRIPPPRPDPTAAPHIALVVPLCLPAPSLPQTMVGCEFSVYLWERKAQDKYPWLNVLKERMGL